MSQAAPDPRARILAELERAPEGLDAAELGARLGLHPNTIRWHLGILRSRGAVVSDVETRSTPGRPRVLYRAGPGAAADEYRLLAAVLAETLSRSDDGTGASERAGRAWGAELVAGRRLGETEAVRAVAGLLGEQGFDPVVEDGAIEMRRCPYHDVAEANPDVVCSVHRGFIAGALAELGSKLTVTALDIFPRPGVCVARLREPAA